MLLACRVMANGIPLLFTHAAFADPAWIEWSVDNSVLTPDNPTTRITITMTWEPAGADLRETLFDARATNAAGGVVGELFGDGIGAVNCRDPRSIQFGSCGNWLFGGLAMVDSHLSGNIRIRFTPPENNITRFEISFEGGFVGDDAVLTTPQFFKMWFQQARVDEVPGLVSSGNLDLTTGLISDLQVYAAYSSTALFALVGSNPNWPRVPITFKNESSQQYYGSAWARFEQRDDGLLAVLGQHRQLDLASLHQVHGVRAVSLREHRLALPVRPGRSAQAGRGQPGRGPSHALRLRGR